MAEFCISNLPWNISPKSKPYSKIRGQCCVAGAALFGWSCEKEAAPAPALTSV